MKDNSKLNLEELLQSKFEHHEVDASHLWQNLSQQLPTSSSSSGWSAISKWAAFIAGASVVAAVTWFALNSNSNSSPSAQHTDSVVNNQKEATVIASDTSEQAQQLSPTSSEEFVEDVHGQMQSNAGDPYNAESDFVFQDQEIQISESVENFIQTNIQNRNVNQENETHAASENNQMNDTEQTAHFSVVPTNQNELRYFLFAAQDRANAYQWKLGNGVESESQAFAVQFEDEGEYEVVLNVEVNGIIKSESQVVKIYRPAQLNVVNAFAPGSDGKNDTFNVLENSVNVASVQHFTMSSSAGRLVFDSYNSAEWDGRVNGELQQPGSYFWFLEYVDKSGAALQAKGKIQLFAE